MLVFKRHLIFFILVNSISVAKSQTTYSSIDDGTSIFLNFKLNTSDTDFISSATGFCIKVNSDYFILTNRHCVESHDFYSRKFSHDIPKGMVYSASNNNNQYYTRRCNFELGGQSLIRKGTYLGQPTDIIAIPIEQFSQKDIMKPIDYSQKANLKTGDEVFYISSLQRLPEGPLKFFTFTTIYSNPIENILLSNYRDPSPAVLISDPIMHGTSGSPVFSWKDKTKPPILVGIIGGNNRHGQGIFWKIEAIQELIKELKN